MIYYWDPKSETVYTLFAYAKSDQQDLTPNQLRMPPRIVREEFG